MSKQAGPLVAESPYIPSSISTVSGRSTSPDRDGTMHCTNPISMQYINHANLTANSPYAYAEHGTSHGVSDVDIDDKICTAYASLNEFQDRRPANGGVHSRVNGANMGHEKDQYAGVPNKAAADTGNMWRTMRCMLIIFVLLTLCTFVLSVGATGLSVYNFLLEVNGKKEGTENLPTANPVTDEEFGECNSTAQIEELKTTISMLKEQINMLSTVHQNHYLELIGKISNQSRPTIGENSTATGGVVRPYTGCVTATASCHIPVPGQSETIPTHTQCETNPVALEVEGMHNVNITCSVDNSVAEINPVISTMNIYDGEITCLCYALSLRSAVSQNVRCIFSVTRCSSTLSVTTSK